jgi:hypothetical protein
MSLPPSGPMAISAGWYNRPMNVPPNDPNFVGEDPSAAAAAVAANGASPGNAASNTPGPDGQSGSDPLSSMEPLRQTLPDVAGAATSAAAGDS